MIRNWLRRRQEQRWQREYLHARAVLAVVDEQIEAHVNGHRGFMADCPERMCVIVTATLGMEAQR